MLNPHIAFLSKVDTRGLNLTACWPWLGAGKGNGYGQTKHRGVNMGAHRKAYFLFCDHIPDGMDVCHTCDNRWCVNPEHLYVATRRKNMADCKLRGRATGHHRKIIKEAQAQEAQRRLNIITAKKG